MTFYGFAKKVVGMLLKPLFRIEIIGLEHFPKEGSVLLCSNHINNFDPPVVGITAPRPIAFMAKEELFKRPLLRFLLKKLHAFPVKRGMSDREAFRKALHLLKSGQVLGLFPEGTRSKTGKLGKGLAGAGFFALKTQAVVIPCAIIGTYRPFKKLKVIYGKPIEMEELRESKASAEKVTAVIMENISYLIKNHQ